MTTLITGASGGIGEAFARRLAAEKHDLFLIARSEDKLRNIGNELTEKYGIRCDHFGIDLSKNGADKSVFDEADRLRINVDWLINNAGFGSMGDFAKLELERELEMIRLNIAALIGLTHQFLPGMRSRGLGTIINVSSAAGFQPIPFMATYAATKSFVTSFTEAIAEENRPYGVRVLALCPGSTRTNFFEAAKMERAFSAKGQQTAEQVVDTALRAVSKGRSKIVSGWSNWLVASATNLIPNSLITKGIGKGLRKRFNNK